MSNCYQLPCPKCGYLLEVEGRHAGGIVDCVSCRTPVDVPTFRILKTLAVSGKPSIFDSGGEPNRIKSVLFAVGFGVAVIAAVAGGFLYQYASNMVQNTEVDSEKVANDSAAVVEEASVGALWNYWNTSIEGAELPDWQESAWRRYNRQGRTLVKFAYGFLGVAAAGLVAVIASFFLPKTKRT